MKEYHIKTVKDFEQPVQDLIQSGVKQLLLHGELGAGKTTLVSKWVHTLTGKDHLVQSPTYTYFHTYDESIVHIDMWRIDEVEQLHELGFYEMLDQYEYSAIERPKRIEQYTLPGTYAEVRIIKNNDETRTLSINYDTR